MIDYADIAQVVRQVAEREPLTRPRTRAKLFIAAHLLEQMAAAPNNTDPEAAVTLTPESLVIHPSEDSETATEGPVLPEFDPAD